MGCKELDIRDYYRFAEPSEKSHSRAQSFTEKKTYSRFSHTVISNYRYNNPKLGRWLSRDPIEENGGYNLYAMVGNDPVNWWDWLGLNDFFEYSVPGYGKVKITNRAKSAHIFNKVHNGVKVLTITYTDKKILWVIPDPLDLTKIEERANSIGGITGFHDAVKNFADAPIKKCPDKPKCFGYLYDNDKSYAKNMLVVVVAKVEWTNKKKGIKVIDHENRHRDIHIKLLKCLDSAYKKYAGCYKKKLYADNMYKLLQQEVAKCSFISQRDNAQNEIKDYPLGLKKERAEANEVLESVKKNLPKIEKNLKKYENLYKATIKFRL